MYKRQAFNAATNLSEVTMCNAWKDRYENACKAFYKEKEELLHPEWFNTVERMDPLTPTGVLDSWFIDETRVFRQFIRPAHPALRWSS